jgi:hypothetical protein
VTWRRTFDNATTSMLKFTAPDLDIDAGGLPYEKRSPPKKSPVEAVVVIGRIVQVGPVLRTMGWIC